MDVKASILIIVVIALVTALLRFLPFIVFSNKETPKFISFLGKYLPYAIMGMLVVYCLKGVSVTQAPHGIPELIAIVVTGALHWWKNNTLLSVVSGTVLYMILVQLVFV